MSTKTTFKRVALVAVAALGLSLVAVAPASAATSAATSVTAQAYGPTRVGQGTLVRFAIAHAATTATSATRLKVVFVDILFLSVSRSREFPSFGLNQISLIRFDESHVLIHQIPHRVSGRGEETYF